MAVNKKTPKLAIFIFLSIFTIVFAKNHYSQESRINYLKNNLELFNSLRSDIYELHDKVTLKIPHKKNPLEDWQKKGLEELEMIQKKRQVSFWERFNRNSIINDFYKKLNKHNAKDLKKFGVTKKEITSISDKLSKLGVSHGFSVFGDDDFPAISLKTDYCITLNCSYGYKYLPGAPPLLYECNDEESPAIKCNDDDFYTIHAIDDWFIYRK